MANFAELQKRIQALPIWNGKITMIPLDGGITNQNYIVRDQGGRYVLRLGKDILKHHVMRFNELAATQAAYMAGLSPKLVYHEEGIMVLHFIQSKTLTADAVRDKKNLQRIVPLIKSCHLDVPKYLRGPVLSFWVFHVIRDYANRLLENNSLYRLQVPELLNYGNVLEKTVGPVDIVFGHNDLLAANFLDDGQRLWLIDWDYAGFNSPLFDLGGLASNNGFSVKEEQWLLETYFDKPITDEVWHSYQAMKCASLLRETLWSMVSELDPRIDFNYSQYTAENLQRFATSYNHFIQS